MDDAASEERIRGILEKLERDRNAPVLSDPVLAAAELVFEATLQQLHDCAADVGATPAQCVASLEAVSTGIVPSRQPSGSGSEALLGFRSFGDTRRAELAAKARVLAPLATLMRAHAGDARVQAAGCDLVVCLFLSFPRSLFDEPADLAAVVDAVLAAACAHTADLVAHFRAGEAITALCNPCGGLPCAVPHARVMAACDAVCVARGIHAACDMLQNTSLLTLGHLCRRAGMHAGTLQAALASLRALDNDVSAACCALTNMAEGCDDVELLTLCDAAAADVVAAMRRGLPFNSRLQARGSFTLAKMAENDDAAARVSAVGGIEAVVDALRVYNPQRGSGRWWMVEESAWYALLMLTRSDDARAQRAIDAGALALPPAANAEGIEERNTLFERLRALQQRHADAADAAMQAEQRTCALASCGAKDAHFKRCAACRGVAYCCKEHQVDDWPSHKAACKAARKAKEAADEAGATSNA